MASNLSNIIVPQMFSAEVLEQSLKKNALVNSGIVTLNPIMSAYLASAGDGATLLSFKNLDESATEANVSSTDPAEKATPEQVASRKQSFKRIARNKGWTSSDLEAALLSVDPANAIAAFSGDAMNKWRQTSMLKILTGCVNETVSSTLVNTIAVEATGDYTSATKISAGAVMDTLSVWGDFGTRDMILGDAVLFMHSATYFALAKADPTSFQRASDQAYGFITYMGLPVIVDDTLPKVAGSTSGFKYTTYIVKRGALNFGYAPAKNPVAIQRVEAGGNGGGVEELWLRDNFAFHIKGYTFDGTVAGDNVTDAELANAANWTQVYSDKAIGVAALVHNI
jgi:hypothetical protein